MTPLWDAWRLSTHALRKHPILWVPFLASAAVEAVFISLVWAAPHPPFSSLLAPIVRYFFGEANLHYPAHLWFMYFAMKYTNAAASFVAGAFFSALACALLEQAYWRVPVSPRSALASGRIRYRRVVAVWTATWVIAKLCMDLFVRIAPRTHAGLAAGIALTLGLQALFGYAVPLTVYQNCSWWRAVGRSVREAVQSPAATLCVSAVAGAPVIAWSLYAPAVRVGAWMRQAPEIVLGFIAARWAITAASDLLLTVGLATLWFVRHRPAAPGAARRRRIFRAMKQGRARRA